MDTKEKTAEEAAIEYGESFKTGEFFERIRIEAFKAGAAYAEQKLSAIEVPIDKENFSRQDVKNLMEVARTPLLKENQSLKAELEAAEKHNEILKEKAESLEAENKELRRLMKEGMEEAFMAGKNADEWDQMCGWIQHYSFSEWVAKWRKTNKIESQPLPSKPENK